MRSRRRVFICMQSINEINAAIRCSMEICSFACWTIRLYVIQLLPYKITNILSIRLGKVSCEPVCADYTVCSTNTQKPSTRTTQTQYKMLFESLFFCRSLGWATFAPDNPQGTGTAAVYMCVWNVLCLWTIRVRRQMWFSRRISGYVECICGLCLTHQPRQSCMPSLTYGPSFSCFLSSGNVFRFELLQRSSVRNAYILAFLWTSIVLRTDEMCVYALCISLPTYACERRNCRFALKRSRP